MTNLWRFIKGIIIQIHWSLAIGSLVIVILILQRTSYSQADLPYPNPRSAEDQPPLCHQVFLNEMHLMRNAWFANLIQLTSQEEPASDMVDEAFEDVRTLRCWMEYLCRGVRYSGNANPQESAVIGLLESHVGEVPGCDSPEDIEIPTTELRYINECHVDAKTNTETLEPQKNYNDCMHYLELQFGEPLTEEAATEQRKHIKNTSTVYMMLESQLKQTNAKQRARAVEDKLFRILNRMHALEAHAEQMKNFMQTLYNLMPCYAKKCT